MIIASELSYTYRKTTTPAIRDLHFSGAKGEAFGLLGPSGAGKSATQKVLTGLLKGYTGEVFVAEQSLTG